VTQGVRLLLMRAVKWIAVPFALLLIGYFVAGPLLMPHISGYFMRKQLGGAGGPKQQP